MADMTGVPDAPPAWWPYSWWPPRGEREFEVGIDEAWKAKINRDYEQHSDRDQGRHWAYQSNVATHNHREETGAEDTRAAQKTDHELRLRLAEDTRAAQKIDHELRLRLTEMGWQGYLSGVNELRALTVQNLTQAFNDNSADTRAARGVMYKWDATLLESIADKFQTLAAQMQELAATVTGLKEYVGPPRGGFQPQTEA